MEYFISLHRVYTPEYNAVQERMNRTVVEMALAMLFQANIPLSCWSLAVETAMYIRNRCPSSSNENFCTPFEVLFGEVPELSHLRVFGARVFYHVPSELRNKLEPKSLEGIFVGYDQLNRAYRILPKGTYSRIVLSRDVIFDEHTITEQALRSTEMDSESVDVISKLMPAECLSSTTPDKSTPDYTDSSIIPAIPLFNPVSVSLAPSVTTAQPLKDSNAFAPRRSERAKRAPEYYSKEFGLFSLKDNFVKNGTLAACYHSVVDFSGAEPSTIKQALSCDENQYWREAIQHEVSSLIQHGVWETEPVPRIGKHECDQDQIYLQEEGRGI
jgi:hypothetical protein